jgi:hypothetical protein
MTTIYKPNALVIEIQTSSPQALHAHLLQSINASVQYCIAASDKSENFADEVIPLMQLQQSLLPAEKDLE